jgi:hypothetical protein
MRNSGRIIVFAILFVLLLVSCNDQGGKRVASGLFEGREVLVSSESSGRLVWWCAREGEEMKRGRKVGQVDSTYLYLQLKLLEAKLRGVEASSPDILRQTAALRNQLDKLQQERERTARLLEAKAANQKQLDDIEAQMKMVESQKEALTSLLGKANLQVDAEREALEIQMQLVKEQLSKCQIRCPIDGVILQSYVDQGELAGQGMPLFQMVNLDTLQLRAYLSAEMLHTVELGQQVDVYADAPNHTMQCYPGRISWISPKAEFTPKTVQTKDERENLVYAVKVEVPNNGQLKIGMYGEIRFQ